MKKYLSLFLAIIMTLSVLLSSVSCDQLLAELLDESVLEMDTDEEDLESEEETTKKKKNEKTTAEYETATERYSEEMPEYTYPSFDTDWATEIHTEVSTYPTEWPSEIVTGHACCDYPVVDHYCDMCFVRINNCFDDNCDAFCDVCGISMGNSDHRCIDKAPRDHMCDTCYVWMSDCRDKNFDHCCDICGMWMSECGLDYDRNHICDECGQIFSECYDYDNDSYCDHCYVSMAKHISAFGMMGADSYLENGKIVISNEAGSWVQEQVHVNGGIKAADKIGFRGWAVLFDSEGNEMPINAFGYSINGLEIDWSGKRGIANDINDMFGFSEASRYTITMSFVGNEEGTYIILLYAMDIEGNVYLLDQWGEIIVYVETKYTPDEPDVSEHSCYDKLPRDHYCDECGIRMTECQDKKSNHTCYICGEWMSECGIDENYDHRCDICRNIVSDHYDWDWDGMCDLCFMPVDDILHDCVDKSPYDHYCDECGNCISGCVSKKSEHACYICGAWMSDCVDCDYDGNCDVCGMKCGDVETPEYISISIAEAISMVEGFEKNQYTDEKYIITGVITEIINQSYGIFYISDGIDTIYIYRCYNEDGSIRFDSMENPPQVGDTVTVLGIIGVYADPQLKDVWLLDCIPA